MTTYVFPVPPQDVRCTKCGKTAYVAVNIGRPGIESECPDKDCPISLDPDHQPSGADGTLIGFPDADT